MNKKLFGWLVFLMCLSLIGIIFVQAYFINNSLKNEEENFNRSVKRALSFVSKDIETYELRTYANRLQPYINQYKKPDTLLVKQLYITSEDKNNKKTIIHSNTIVEGRYKIPSTFTNIDVDSFIVSDFSSEIKTKIYNTNTLDGNRFLKPEQNLTEFTSMNKLDRQQLSDSFKTMLKIVPIYKRVTEQQVKDYLARGLKNEGINLDFEFAIFDNDLATKIHSLNFEKNPGSTIGVPVFLDLNNQSNYNLYVDFPKRKKYLYNSILWMIGLSIAFTGVIVVAFVTALYQLIKQRQISEIKTDFINNMTHEFKTPIATINLALDSIKNPKIINDSDKVKRYLKMIKDENKRMHAQVENVLRISKLEKNELNISKVRLKLHDIIEDAITHVQLIVEDRNGYINTHFNAVKTSVLANDTHFTNVIVNILDNAIKYSDETPKIDVYTENIGNNVIVKITDQGNGMSKQVAKRIFEKFYREHTGNVHNVKGHGLGLAYVKRIVDDHQGHITVESEKEKGSTFTLKLPLIT